MMHLLENIRTIYQNIPTILHSHKNNNPKPIEEIVEERISYQEAVKLDHQNNPELERQRHEETLRKEDKSK